MDITMKNEGLSDLLRKLFSRLLRTNIVSNRINFDDEERIEGFHQKEREDSSLRI